MKSIVPHISLLLLFFFTFCSTSTNSEISYHEEIEILIKKKFPSYELANIGMFRDFESPLPNFTDTLERGILSYDPLLQEFDLLRDGDKDVIATIYKTTALEDSRYDSLFEARSVLIMKNSDSYSFHLDRLYYRNALFNNSRDIKLNQIYRFINPTIVDRDYPFYDEFQIDKPGVIGITPFGIGVTQWISVDSAVTTTLFAY